MRSLIPRLACLAAMLAASAGCQVGGTAPALRGAAGAGDARESATPAGSLQAWRALSEGATAVAEGRAADALPLFERAVDGGIDDPMLHFLRGVAYLDLGRGEEAVADLREAVARDPSDAASYGALARALRATDAPAAALDVLADGILATDGDLRLLTLLGHVQLEQGLWSEALDTLRRVAETDPSSLEAHRALGLLFAEVGDAERAELSWRSALRLAPRDAIVLAGLGNALRDQGRDEEALEAYRAASRLEPRSAVHLANVGGELERLGRMPEARAAYERALTADPLPAGPRAYVEMCLGDVLVQLGEEDGALVAYESAVADDPLLGPAHESLGLLLLDRDREPRAFAHLRSALESGSLSAEAALHLGLLAERRGEPEVTRQCARLLALVGETDSIAAFRSAQLMVRSTDPEVHDADEAVRILRGLLDGPFAGQGAVWNVLGEALAGQGSYEEAAAALDHALQTVDPEGPLGRRYQSLRTAWLAQLDAR